MNMFFCIPNLNIKNSISQELEISIRIKKLNIALIEYF